MSDPTPITAEKLEWLSGQAAEEYEAWRNNEHTQRLLSRCIQLEREREQYKQIAEINAQTVVRQANEIRQMAGALMKKPAPRWPRESMDEK
jgi:hypothetical protein